MSALARPTLTLTATEQPSVQTTWIPLPRAAEILGKSEGHLRRVCTDELASKGAAKQIRIEGVSKPVWHIHCSYDARLAREHVMTIDPSRGPSLGEVWLGATQAQRDKAMAKAEILIAFRAMIQSQTVELKTAWPSFARAIALEHGTCPAERTLYRWNEQAPPSSSPIAVAASLIDARTRVAEQAASPQAIDFFRGLYLTPAQMKVSQCYRLTKARAEKEGWSWPSLRTVQVNLKKWVDEQMAVMAREGKDQWRRKFQTPIHQDPDAFQAGECWEADHTELDFFIRVPQGGKWTHDRPWLTCWMDRRSRRIVGWHIGLTPDSEAIRAALLRAFRDESVSLPAYAVMDNGKDFASEAIGGLTKQQRRNLTKSEREESERAWGGLLGQLGIEAHFNLPYNKDGKGRVERLMRTVHEDFDNTFHSYRGSDRVRVPEEHIKTVLANIMDLPTLDQVIAKFADWVRAYNHRDQHNIEDLLDTDGLTKISPAAFYESRLFRRSRLADPKVLALLELTWSRELKITRHGVSMKIGVKTVHYGGADPVIKGMVGKPVRVSYDPNDMSSINVWSTDGRFLSRALMNSMHGGFRGDEVSREALKAALSRQRDERKRIAQPIDHFALMGDAVQVAAEEQRKLGRQKAEAREAERRGKRSIEDMPPVRLVNTDLDQQAEALERAKRSRKVAGADFESVPSIADIFDAPSSFGPAPAAPRLTDWDEFEGGGFIGDSATHSSTGFDSGSYDAIDAIRSDQEGRQ
jgi:transposase InsO family protein